MLASTLRSCASGGGAAQTKRGCPRAKPVMARRSRLALNDPRDSDATQAGSNGPTRPVSTVQAGDAGMDGSTARAGGPQIGSPSRRKRRCRTPTTDGGEAGGLSATCGGNHVGAAVAATGTRNHAGTWHMGARARSNHLAWLRRKCTLIRS